MYIINYIFQLYNKFETYIYIYIYIYIQTEHVKNKINQYGESNRIRTVPEYGHSRYLRNHKSYKKKYY